MNDEFDFLKLAGGNIAIWLDECGVICIKTMDKFNDPVELSEHEATELANTLIFLVNKSKGATQRE
jgi:hypothetical protein